METEDEKMTAKKWVFRLIVAGYIVSIIAATMFVPVKAMVSHNQPGQSDADAMEDMGYYPIWQVLGKKDTGIQPEPGLHVNITLNHTAWIIQYIFFTLMFISLYYQAHRHYRRGR